MKNHHHNGHIDPTSTSRGMIHETIAMRAYELWVNDGKPENQADAFWLAAEREQMTGEQVPKRKRPKPEPTLPVSF